MCTKRQLCSTSFLPLFTTIRLVDWSTQFSLTLTHNRHTRIKLKMILIFDSQTQTNSIKRQYYRKLNLNFKLSFPFNCMTVTQSLSTNYLIQWWFNIIAEFHQFTLFTHQNIHTFTTNGMNKNFYFFFFKRLTFVFQFLMSILFHFMFFVNFQSLVSVLFQCESTKPHFIDSLSMNNFTRIQSVYFSFLLFRLPFTSISTVVAAVY